MSHPVEDDDCRDNAEMIFRHQEWLRELEYREAQAALPPHKRDGYAERMAAMAEFEADVKREEFYTRGQE